VIACLTVAFTYRRIFFGIDFTDDASYLSIPYSFVLGNKPFVDEALLQQSGTLFLVPFIWLYVKIVGSTAGLMLFGRHLFLATSLLASVIAWRAFRKNIWVAAAVFAYIPISIAGLSYNTIGNFGMLIGGMLALIADQEKNSKAAFASGLVLVLGSLAYPVFIVPAVLVVVLLSFFSWSESRKIAFMSWIGFGVGAVFNALLLLSFGWQNLLKAYQYSKEDGGGGGIEKFWGVLVNLVLNFPYPWIVVFVCAGIYGLSRASKSKIREYWLFLVYPVAFLIRFSGARDVSLSEIYVSYLTLLGLVAFFMVRGDSRARKVFMLVWIPGSIAGLMMGWSSSNGFLNHGVGAFTAAIASLYLILRVVEVKAPPSAIYFTTVFFTLHLFAQVSFGNQFVYRDAPLGELTQRVPDGPFAGIWTTPSKASFIQDLEGDVRTFGSGKKSILFYDLFSAGYLFSALKPTTPEIALKPVAMGPYNRMAFVDYYKKPENDPDLVFEFFSIPITPSFDLTFNSPTENRFGDPFRAFFDSKLGYRQVVVRKNYRVLAK